LILYKSLCRLTIGYEKKSSPHISDEALGSPNRNTKRGSVFALTLQRIVCLKVPKFRLTIALQHCKLIRLAVRYSRLSLNCQSFFLSITVYE